MMAVEEMAIWCAMLLPSCSHRLTKWIVPELLSATIFAFLFLGAHHFWDLTSYLGILQLLVAVPAVMNLQQQRILFSLISVQYGLEIIHADKPLCC
ncbi:hypothetical protein POTOM_022245 [Populus tomentosa]|uniref:Uncharacterized protein n=1 Tax=Populus tomentosa TaxID=118781 RepID=A0A8X7ZV89_POPTO|nr:hypothetical protein POTOM_022245 [Populus tomentosa]